MNEAKKTEIRVRHQPDENRYCKSCASRSLDGTLFYVVGWPCQVIRILDAWDAEIAVSQ